MRKALSLSSLSMTLNLLAIDATISTSPAPLFPRAYGHDSQFTTWKSARLSLPISPPQDDEAVDLCESGPGHFSKQSHRETFLQIFHQLYGMVENDPPYSIVVVQLPNADVRGLTVEVLKCGKNAIAVQSSAGYEFMFSAPGKLVILKSWTGIAPGAMVQASSRGTSSRGSRDIHGATAPIFRFGVISDIQYGGCIFLHQEIFLQMSYMSNAV